MNEQEENTQETIHNYLQEDRNEVGGVGPENKTFQFENSVPVGDIFFSEQDQKYYEVLRCNRYGGRHYVEVLARETTPPAEAHEPSPYESSSDNIPAEEFWKSCILARLGNDRYDRDIQRIISDANIALTNYLDLPKTIQKGRLKLFLDALPKPKSEVDPDLHRLALKAGYSDGANDPRAAQKIAEFKKTTSSGITSLSCSSTEGT